MGETIRDNVFLCGDCYFWDIHMESGYGPDKCPYCGSDNWITYEKVEYEEDEE